MWLPFIKLLIKYVVALYKIAGKLLHSDTIQFEKLKRLTYRLARVFVNMC